MLNKKLIVSSIIFVSLLRIGASILVWFLSPSKDPILIKGLNNAKLFSIASKTKENLIEFKKKFDIDEKYCFSNYEDLIACDKIDIIYIALPHNLHFDWQSDDLFLLTH